MYKARQSRFNLGHIICIMSWYRDEPTSNHLSSLIHLVSMFPSTQTCTGLAIAVAVRARRPFSAYNIRGSCCAEACSCCHRLTGQPVYTTVIYQLIKMRLISGVFVQDQFIGASLYISPSFSCGLLGKWIAHACSKGNKAVYKEHKGFIALCKDSLLTWDYIFPPIYGLMQLYHLFFRLFVHYLSFPFPP